MKTTREKYGPGLCIRVPEDIRKLVKTCADEKNITMQKWVLRAIMKQIERENVFE
jgi:uncharacterized protein (DUF1778 family)